MTDPLYGIFTYMPKIYGKRTVGTPVPWILWEWNVTSLNNPKRFSIDYRPLKPYVKNIMETLGNVLVSYLNDPK